VASEIEVQTRDFVLKKLGQELKGTLFEDFVAQLLKVMGYNTRKHGTGKGADGGVDLIAYKDELGFEPPVIKVQVKSGDGTSGDAEVSSLYGKCDKGEHALFVTRGDFSSKAMDFARSKPNLRLVAGPELVGLILQHYETLTVAIKDSCP
jgi:restriction system protein